MIADLRPYPEYKESGLAWLGQVPGHWEKMRLKRVLRAVDDRSSTGAETLLSLRRDHGVVVYADHFSRPPQGMTTVGFKRVRVGQLVVNRMQANNGLVFHSRLDGVVSPDYSVFEARAPLVMDYLSDLLRTPLYRAHFRQESTGLGTGSAGFLRLYDDRLLNTTVETPSFSEQAAIVRFLSWANGRLERAIRAKRKVIALLNEQKQAIIHRAVTRGLPSTGSGQATSVPLKPSGILWLGDIPQHWETPMFGRLLTRIEQGWSPVAAEGELASDQWAVLMLSAVRRGVFNRSAIKPVSRLANIPTNIEVNEGDLLLTRSNTRDRVGDVCIAHGPRPRTLLCDLIYRIRLREGALVPEFLVYQLLSRAGRGQIERDARGSSGTMPKISQGHIKSWRILLPPIEEQQRIVERIDAEGAPANAAISRLEREIELLREYRTRLVADVVTGKLDVREAAARLPEESAPVTAEDDADVSDELEPADEEAAV